METARRLGTFSLVLAFLLFVFYDQTEASNIAWRDQLMVYGILFSTLGLFLVTRFRKRTEKSTRFSWIKNWLFKKSENKKRR